jgi:hypothetical protein
VLIVADEDVDAIAVERDGQADGGEHLLEHGGVAMEVFRRAEMQGDHLGRGIVDGAEQRHRGPAALEPVEGAAIELDELARGLFARPPAAVLRRPPAMHGRQAERASEPAHRFAGDRDGVEVAQLLGGMRVIEPGVDIAQKRLHLDGGGDGQAAVREPSAAAMTQRGGTAGPKPLLETLKLARRHP